MGCAVLILLGFYDIKNYNISIKFWYQKIIFWNKKIPILDIINRSLFYGAPFEYFMVFSYIRKWFFIYKKFQFVTTKIAAILDIKNHNTDTKNSRGFFHVKQLNWFFNIIKLFSDIRNSETSFYHKKVFWSHIYLFLKMSNNLHVNEFHL